MSLFDRPTDCKDCKGEGYIYPESIPTGYPCIICNGSGTTSHGPHNEAEQVLLFKIAWDFINGKEKGWYH